MWEIKEEIILEEKQELTNKIKHHCLFLFLKMLKNIFRLKIYENEFLFLKMLKNIFGTKTYVKI
jgi:hypothetical protein